MTWDTHFLPIYSETLVAEGKWWHLNCPQLREILLLGAGGRVGHRAMMPPQSPCSITSCLQGDWRYQPAQESVGTQIRWLGPGEHSTGNFTGNAPTGLPQAPREGPAFTYDECTPDTESQGLFSSPCLLHDTDAFRTLAGLSPVILLPKAHSRKVGSRHLLSDLCLRVQRNTM